MDQIHLFSLATRQAEWLAVRQKVVAGNIANATTPGYKARDVSPFSAVLQSGIVAMTRTNKQHMDVTGSYMESAAIKPEKNGEITHSGNTVSVEEELRKGSDVGREMSLNTAVVKSFHRLLIATVKGG